MLLAVVPSLGLHLLILLTLILLAFCISIEIFTYGKSGAEETVKAMLSNDRFAFCNSTAPARAANLLPLLLPDLGSYVGTTAEKRRLGDQAIKAQQLQCMHAAFIGRYVGNYYMAVVASVVFAGIAAVALFLVGPKGWTASSPYLVNVLIVSGAIAAFYGGFPALFRQADMVAAHKAQFLRYEALLDGIKSQIAAPHLMPRTCSGSSVPVANRVRNKSFPIAEFIACIDDSLAALDLPFALNPSGGPDYSTIGGVTVRK